MTPRGAPQEATHYRLLIRGLRTYGHVVCPEHKAPHCPNAEGLRLAGSPDDWVVEVVLVRSSLGMAYSPQPTLLAGNQHKRNDGHVDEYPDPRIGPTDHAEEEGRSGNDQGDRQPPGRPRENADA
jgi:hypothetical protein